MLLQVVGDVMYRTKRVLQADGFVTFKRCMRVAFTYCAGRQAGWLDCAGRTAGCLCWRASLESTKAAKLCPPHRAGRRSGMLRAKRPPRPAPGSRCAPSSGPSGRRLRWPRPAPPSPLAAWPPRRPPATRAASRRTLWCEEGAGAHGGGGEGWLCVDHAARASMSPAFRVNGSTHLLAPPPCRASRRTVAPSCPGPGSGGPSRWRCWPRWSAHG